MKIRVIPVIPAMALAFVSLSAVASAERLTTRDIIELTKAGLGEDVLLALVDVSKGVYEIDTATLKQLKSAGVPERVIVALVRSGREEPPAPAVVAAEPEPEPAPQVIVIDHPAPEVREVPVAVPVYIPVPSRSGRHTRPAVQVEPTYVPFQSGPPAVRPAPDPPKEPVYWGYGGKRRPDAWAPPPTSPRTEDDGRKRK